MNPSQINFALRNVQKIPNNTSPSVQPIIIQHSVDLFITYSTCYLHYSCVSVFWKRGDDKSGHTHSTEGPNYFRIGTLTTTAACDGNQAYRAQCTHTLAKFSDYNKFYIACNYYFHRKSSFSLRARAQKRRGGAEEKQQKKKKRGLSNKIELSWVWLLQKRSKQ